MKSKRLNETKIALALFSVLLVCALALGVCGLNTKADNTAYAATAAWDGSVATAFDGGTGSVDNPYQIATAEQLAYLASQVNGDTDYSGKYLRLTDDVDLDSKTWTPIGTTNKQFKGTFNGDGHVIKNLQVAVSLYAGLFGNSSGVVINLGISSGSVLANSNTAGGIVAYNKGSIVNCFNNGVTVTGSQYFGGIVGQNHGIIVNCYSTATVIKTGMFPAGGIVGWLSSGSVTNCYWLVSGAYDTVASNSGTGTVTNCDSFTSATDTVLYNGTGSEVSLFTALNNGRAAYNTTNAAAIAAGTKVSAKPWAADDATTPTNGGYPVFSNNWIEAVAMAFDGGTGTGADPYQIATAEQLALLASQVNGGTAYDGLYFKLTADIDLGGKEWIPIGTFSNTFNGNFDGFGHVVSGMNVIASVDDLAGLFTATGSGAVIKNLGVAGGSIIVSEKNTMAGAIVAYFGDGSVMDNCYNESVNIDLTGVTSHAGGVVGLNYGSVSNSYNKANLSVTDCAGGIACENHGTVVNCYNTGSLTSSDDSNLVSIGGIVGWTYVDASYLSMIANCYNVGTLSIPEGGYGTKGGIAGSVYSEGELAAIISNNYWLDTSATPALGNDENGLATLTDNDSFTAAAKTVQYNGTGSEVSLVTALNNGRAAYNTTNAAAIAAGTAVKAMSWIADGTPQTNGGYPVHGIPTAEFGKDWLNYLPTLTPAIAQTNITTIHFLTTVPEGYTNSETQYNGIDIWYKTTTGESTTTYDIAFVFDGKIMAKQDCYSMFNSYRALTFVDFSNFDTSNVTDMANMFNFCDKLISLDLSGFDTSNVIYMENMFISCCVLTSLNLTGFDTSQVTNMMSMFNSCGTLKCLDLSSFDMSKVTNVSNMFAFCDSLSNVKAPYNLLADNPETKDIDESKKIALPASFVRDSDSAKTPVTEITSSNCTTVGTGGVVQTYNRQYSVTLNGNSGTFAVGYTKPVTYIYGTGLTSLPDSTQIVRAGYAFLGWTATNLATDTTYITSISTTDSGNKTFYAKWRQLHTHGSGASAIVFDNELSAFTSTLGTVGETKNYVLTSGFTATDNITIYGTVNLCLNDKTLNMSTYQINVGSGSTLNIYDCSSPSSGKITGVTPYGTGYGVVTVYGNLTLFSGKIQNTRNDSGVAIANFGTTTIDGGTVYSAKGNAIRQDTYSATSSTYVKSGRVESGTNNTLEILDGTAYISGGTLITSAQGSYGGATIVTSTDTTLNVSGGTISASKTWAISCAAGSTFYLSGAPILSSDSTDGCVVRLCYYPGSVSFHGNNGKTGSDLAYYTGGKLKLLGYSLSATGTVIVDGVPIEDSDKYELLVYGVPTGYGLVYDVTNGNLIYDLIAASVTFDTNGATAGGEVTINFATFEAAISYAKGLNSDSTYRATVKLMKTANITSRLEFSTASKWIVIDLNGFNINRGLTVSTTNGEVMRVTNGTLVIKDSSTGGNGKITGGYNASSGGGIYQNGGTIFVESGNIAGNSARNRGGVCVEGGTFQMSGGSVYGNYSENTVGGIGVYTGATLNLLGTATVTGNRSNTNDRSAGVDAHDNSTFNLSGGASITDNWANGTLNTTTNKYEKGTSGTASNLFVADNSIIKIGAQGSYTGSVSVSTYIKPTVGNPVVITNGWDSNDTGTIGSDVAGRVISTNASSLQKTVNLTYTVSYKPGDNGTEAETSDTKIDSVNLTILGATFTRTGYTQTGWTTTDGAALTHALGAIYSTNEALTLYPVWTANTTAITLDKWLGTTDGSTTATYDSTSFTNFIAATRAGYSIEGYYTATSEGVKVINESGALVASVANYTDANGKWIYTGETLTLYAQWTANKYKVTTTLTNVGSSGTTGTNAATAGTAYELTLVKQEGYDLPATITVTVGGTAILMRPDGSTEPSGYGYEYDRFTGKIRIYGTSIIDNITITATATAGNFYWTDVSKCASDFGEGQLNTSAKTLVIKTAAELGLFAYNLSLDYSVYNGYTVTLYNDIDLSANYWIPVNAENITLNGNGHKITGLKIDATSIESYVGMFGSLTDAKFINLYLSGEINDGKDNLLVYKQQYIGLLAGTTDNIVLENCGFDIDINLNVKKSELIIGGIIGLMSNGHSAYGRILNTYAIGAITVTDMAESSEEAAQILIGGYSAFGGGTVSNCYSGVAITTNLPNGNYSTFYTGCFAYDNSATLENYFYSNSTGIVFDLQSGTNITVANMKKTGDGSLEKALNDWITANQASYPTSPMKHWAVDSTKNVNGGYPTFGYSITYLKPDGSAITLPSSYNGARIFDGVAAFVLPTASPYAVTGYTFDKWYTAGTGGTEVTSIAAGTTANQTVYARYTANKYNITYTLNGGTHGTNHPDKHTYDTSTSISDPTKAGYTFEGWTIGDGTTKYKSLTLGATAYTANIALTAVWTLNAPTISAISGYTATYDGSNHDISVTASHGLTTSTLTYQWYKGSVADANKKGTASTQAVRYVADSGTYYCIVTITDGDDTKTAQSTAITVAIAEKEVAFKWNTTDDASGDEYATAYTYTGSAQGVYPFITNACTGDTVSLTVTENTATNASDTAYTTGSVALDGKDKANYKLPTSGLTKDFAISKADYVMTGITFTNGTAEYDGSAHSLVIGGTLPTGADGIKVTVSYSGSATNVSDGAKTVTATFATTSTNYNAPTAKTATITITAKSLAVVWTGEGGSTSDFSWVYTGSEIKPSASVTTGVGDETVALTISNGATDASSTAYTATAAMTNKNYTLTNTSKQFTITNANITNADNAAFADYEGEYDKAAHGIGYTASKLVTVNNQTITVKYSTNGTTWVDSVTHTNFTNGAQTVYWKVSAPNHNDLTDSNTINVKKKSVDIVWKTAADAAGVDIFAGGAQTKLFVADGTTNYFTQIKPYYIDLNRANVLAAYTVKLGSSTVTAATAAGIYTFTITALADTNYQATAATSERNIEVRQASVTHNDVTVTTLAGIFSDVTVSTENKTASGKIENTAYVGLKKVNISFTKGGTALTVSNVSALGADTSVTVKIKLGAKTDFYVLKNEAYTPKYATLKAIDESSNTANVTLSYEGDIAYGEFSATHFSTYEIVVERTQLVKPSVSGTYAYTGVLQTLTLAGFDANTMSVSGNTQKDAVTKKPVIVAISDTNNYEWKDGSTTNVELEWTISKITLTPSVSGITGKPYDGKITAEGTIGLSGAKNGEAPTATGIFVWISADAETIKVDVSDITLDTGWTTNYELSATSLDDKTYGSSKISKADITNTGAFNDYNAAYDGAAHGIFTSSKLTTINNQTITVKFSTDNSTWVDSVTYTDCTNGAKTVYFLVTAPNHNDLTGNKTVNVTKKALSVTANAKTIFYGDAPTNAGVTYSGFVTGESASNLTGTLAYAYNYTQYGDVGNAYTITPSGLTSNNYEIDFISGTLTVSQKEITVTIAAKTSVYGANIVTLSATDNGIVNNDAGVYSLATTATTTSDVGTYDITGTANDGNYDITFEDEKDAYTITAASITNSGAFSDYSGTYDKAAHGIGYTASKLATVNNQTITVKYSKDNSTWQDSVTYTDFTNGELTVYWKVSAPNHDDLTGSNTVSIGKKEVGLTWSTLTATELVYSKTAKEVTAEATGLETGDTCTVSVGLTSGMNNVNVGTFTYIATALSNSNYKLPTNVISGEYTITAKSIAVEWTGEGKSSSDFSWVYTGSDIVPTADVATGIDGDTVSLTVTGAETNVRAAAYTATASMTSANSNYALTNTTKEFVITKASLTVTAKPHEIFYGDAPTNAGVTYSGFVTGESATNLTGTLEYAYSYTQYGDVGNAYTITPSGLTSNNYEIDFVAGTLTVSQKEITVTIAAKTSVYGANIVTLSATDNGIVNNDAGVYSLATTATTTSDVGTYDITGTANDGNYDITFEGEKDAYTITAASITNSDAFSDYEGEYDKAAHGIGYTASKLVTVNNQTITVKYSTNGTTWVDSVTHTNFTNGAQTVHWKVSAPNHNDLTGSNTVNVTKKAITVTADAKSTVHKADLAELTYTVNPTLCTDAVTGALASTADKAVVGEYDITVGTVTANDNYAVTFVGAKYSVTSKAAVTIIETAQTFTYDKEAKAFAISGTELSGFIVEYFIESAYSADAPVDAGTYKVMVTRAEDESNYAFSAEIAGGLVINKQQVEKPIADDSVFIADGNRKVYEIRADVRYTVEGKMKTEAGNYVVTVALFDKANYEWADGTVDDLTFDFVIRQPQLAEQTAGDDNDNRDNVIVSAEDGFAPDVTIEITEVADSAARYSDGLNANERISAVYDVRMLINGMPEPPEGALTIRILIPEDCLGKTFRLLHFDGTETSEIPYAIEGDYVVLSSDTLNEFVFVSDNTGSLTWLIILLSVLLALLIALAALQLGKRKKRIRTYSFTPLLLAVFIPAGQISAVSVLGALCALAAAYNAYLFLQKRNKGAATEEITAAAEEKEVTYEEVLSIDTVLPDAPVATDAADEETEVLKGVDEEGFAILVRYSKSFTAKLIQASDETKGYYGALKNAVLSYNKTLSRVSWHHDGVHSGRNKLLLFTVRGKTLCLYLALNPDEYADTKYKVERAESKKYADTPCLYRIKNDRRAQYAVDLIDALAEKFGLQKGEERNENYYLPYETTDALIAKELIKELVTKERYEDWLRRQGQTAANGKRRTFVSAGEVGAIMRDEEAAALVIEKKYQVALTKKVKDIVNIDSISAAFSDGETVNLQALRDKNLIGKNVNYVKVLARGSLDKSLTVEANELSIEAVKMILLTGGKVIKITQ